MDAIVRIELLAGGDPTAQEYLTIDVIYKCILCQRDGGRQTDLINAQRAVLGQRARRHRRSSQWPGFHSLNSPAANAGQDSWQ